MPLRRILLALAFYVVLACFVTWPTCLFLSSRVAAHDDSLFSTWRLAWVAHALASDPSRLYHANIFHPDSNTLANSDAVLLQGALAAPLLWSGVDPIAVYNLMLLAGIITSGMAMLLLAWHLTRNEDAALVAGAIFMLVPYRVGHFAHLELQWACFIPLAFWAVHRALDAGSFRHGVGAAVFVWLQLTACVYYGIYLSIATTALVMLLLTLRPRALEAIGGPIVGAGVAGMLAYVSAQPYLEKARAIGLRSAEDIARFSAVPRSYVSAPIENWLWGWTSDAFTGDELYLMPGAVAVGLAAIGLWHAPRRIAIAYGALAALLVDLSLGVNGLVYPLIQAHVVALQGLRATARIALLAFSVMALLAGFGVRTVQARWAFRRVSAAGVCLVAICLEYGSGPMRLMEASSRPAPVYELLARLPRGVVAELPMPRRHQGSRYDTRYMLSSTHHWYPLVNGYSGFIPEHYNQTLDLMEHFPDDRSIERLRALGTRYLIVHEHGYEPAEYVDIVVRLRRRADITPFGRYRDTGGRAELFELKR